MGGGKPTVSTKCDDCTVLFSTDDYSVHLRKEGDWWVADTVNDRGQRRNGAARFSNFNMAEKYLIWDWATTARSDLASGPLGADLARLGYAPDVEVSKTDSGYKICLNNECAVLSVVNATIFSHLMANSVDQIERLVTSGL
ncbi:MULTISPECIES: hypothetical protein [unclassified Mycobacterium]|uniref:hypothetical protein n=1 Tax=unclassified Mycobacterium TaxID=2642494 RepID=UPI000AC6E88A|nr:MULTISPECIES: hypothetical protein [unclassified Mycobacterium]